MWTKDTAGARAPEAPRGIRRSPEAGRGTHDGIDRIDQELDRMGCEGKYTAASDGLVSRVIPCHRSKLKTCI